jgi:hypothetical protein
MNLLRIFCAEPQLSKGLHISYGINSARLFRTDFPRTEYFSYQPKSYLIQVVMNIVNQLSSGTNCI